MYKKYLTAEELEYVKNIEDIEEDTIKEALTKSPKVSLLQLVNNDLEALKMLLRGYARSNKVPYSEVLEAYIYNRTDSEKGIQARLTAEIIKGYRSKTGLSQKAFAKAIDMPVISLEQYERGIRVPSKYMNIVTESKNIKVESEYHLPLGIISSDTSKYIQSELIPVGAYRIVDQDEVGSESYAVCINNKNETKETSFDNFPKDLRACAILGTEYGCTRLVFSEKAAISKEDEKTIKQLMNNEF